MKILFKVSFSLGFVEGTTICKSMKKLFQERLIFEHLNLFLVYISSIGTFQD